MSAPQVVDKPLQVSSRTKPPLLSPAPFLGRDMGYRLTKCLLQKPASFFLYILLFNSSKLLKMHANNILIEQRKCSVTLF